MTSALTRRTRWLLVAGAVAVALLLNVAWVAFGPSDEGDRGKIESTIRKTWSASGLAPRSVTCEQSDDVWSCDVESARGDVVHCPIGAADAFFTNPAASLRDSCKTE